MGCMSVGILLLFTKMKYGICMKYIKSEYLHMPLKSERSIQNIKNIFKKYFKEQSSYKYSHVCTLEVVARNISIGISYF